MTSTEVKCECHNASAILTVPDSNSTANGTARRRLSHKVHRELKRRVGPGF
jgi:hypothetical protein